MLFTDCSFGRGFDSHRLHQLKHSMVAPPFEVAFCFNGKPADASYSLGADAPHAALDTGEGVPLGDL